MLNNAVIVFGDFIEYIVPQNHSMTLGVRFGHHSQLLAWPALRRFKGKTHDALNANTCENGYFGRYCVRGILVRGPALASVFSLAVLSDNDPVEIFRFLLTLRQRGSGTREDSRWSNINVLIIVFPDRKDQTPK